MAAKKRTTTKVRQTSKPVIIRERVSAPRRRATTAVVVASPRAVTHHRRRSSAGGAGPITPQRLMSVGLGGLIYGFIEKQFGARLPTIPVLGKAGTITVAAYLVSKHGRFGGGIVRDVAVAGAVLSGYQLGLNGKISGDVDGAFEEV